MVMLSEYLHFNIDYCFCDSTRDAHWCKSRRKSIQSHVLHVQTPIWNCNFEWLPKRQKIFVILKIKIFGFQDGNWQAFGLFLVNCNTLNYFMVIILTIHIPGLNFDELNSSVTELPSESFQKWRNC